MTEHRLNIEKNPQIRGKDRGSAITTASIIFCLSGAVEVFTSFLLLGLTIVMPSSLPYSTGFGVAIAILAIPDFLAAGLLWNAKRKGGILGFIMAIIGIMASAAFMSIEPVSSIFDLMLSIAVIALIAVGWKHLR